MLDHLRASEEMMLDVDILGGTSAAHYLVGTRRVFGNFGADQAHDFWTSAGWESSADSVGGSIDLSEVEFS